MEPLLDYPPDKNESCRNFAAQHAPIDAKWMVTGDKVNLIDDNLICKYDGKKYKFHREALS